MRSWLRISRHACLRARRLPCLVPPPTPHLPRTPLRFSAPYATAQASSSTDDSIDTRNIPRDNIEAWTQGLLCTFQSNQDGPDHGSELAKASAAARLITAARRRGGHDLMLDMGRQGKWREVVEMVETLVQALWRSDTNAAWQPLQSPLASLGKLSELTDDPIRLPRMAAKDAKSRRPVSIERSLTVEHSLDTSRKGLKTPQALGHSLLGQVWLSLGNMILEDSRSRKPITPEILEIIAILHRSGIMPESIYAYSPEQSSTAGSQPPTLHLLSSQIMTNLSHAEWNARQSAAVAKARDLVESAMGPELPSSDYRIHISHVRHELWLELVLWACLQGGWIAEGGSIVEKVVRQRNPAWSPVSWREIAFPMVEAGSESHIDWAQAGYLFNVGGNERPTEDIGMQPSIERTISSEVISAYVEALIDSVSVGIGVRGTSLGSVVNKLSQIQAFLRNNNFSLEGTSWDAIVQKLLETNSLDVEKGANLAGRILGLSSAYGEEESSRNTPTRDEAWRPLVPYLLDGTALSLGVAHRILKSHIRRGDFPEAWKTFTALQNRVDRNKQLSIAQFFERIKLEPEASDPTKFSFNSRYVGPKHPNLFMMLPRPLMAEFLDLVTDAGEYDFGSWLLASQDVDGPVVGSAAIRDPLVAPALIRFLTAVDQKDVLKQLLATLQPADGSQVLPPGALLAIIESQLRSGDVKLSTTVIANFLTHPMRISENTIVLAAMVAEAYLSGNLNQNFLSSVIQRILTSQAPADREASSSIATLLIPADGDLRRACLCRVYSPRMRAPLSSQAFKTVVRGVLHRHGSAAGRDYICLFDRVAQSIQKERPPTDSLLQPDSPGVERLIGKRSSWSHENAANQRFEVFLDTSEGDHQSDGAVPAAKADALSRLEGGVSVSSPGLQRHTSAWGDFIPTIGVVRSVLVKRIAEMEESGEASKEAVMQDATAVWSIRMLALLGMRTRNIEEQLDKLLHHDTSSSDEKGHNVEEDPEPEAEHGETL